MLGPHARWPPPPLRGRVGEGGKPRAPARVAYPPPAALRASASPARGEATASFAALKRSTRPASAESPPMSCRHRWGRSAGPNGRRAPSPIARADAHAAPSRASRTIFRNGRATTRPLVRERLVRGGAARGRTYAVRPVSSRVYADLHPEEAAPAAVSRGEARMSPPRASWFETTLSRLLTMRVELLR